MDEKEEEIVELHYDLWLVKTPKAHYEFWAKHSPSRAGVFAPADYDQTDYPGLLKENDFGGLEFIPNPLLKGLSF